MDFSLLIKDNTIIIPVIDSSLYDYCANYKKKTILQNKTISIRSADESKKNQEDHQSRSITCKQKYTSGQRLLSICK